MQPIDRLPWISAAAGVALVVLAGCASGPAPYAPRGPGQATGYTDRAAYPDPLSCYFHGQFLNPARTG